MSTTTEEETTTEQNPTTDQSLSARDTSLPSTTTFEMTTDEIHFSSEPTTIANPDVPTTQSESTLPTTTQSIFTTTEFSTTEGEKYTKYDVIILHKTKVLIA